MRPEDALRQLKQEDAKLIRALVIALDAARIQLKVTANMLNEIQSDAWGDVAHACNFQAGVADRALAKARKAGYDS